MNNEDKVFLNNLLEYGYSIFNIEDLSLLKILNSQLYMKLSSYNLEILQKSLNCANTNNERIRCYGFINKVNNWWRNYFSFTSNKLYNLFFTIFFFY